MSTFVLGVWGFGEILVDGREVPGLVWCSWFVGGIVVGFFFAFWGCVGFESWGEVLMEKKKTSWNQVENSVGGCVSLEMRIWVV